MVAIPNVIKLLKVIVLSAVLGIIAATPQIIAAIGVTYGSITAGVGTVILLAIREFIEEEGLQKGELTSADQVSQQIQSSVVPSVLVTTTTTATPGTAAAASGEDDSKGA